jgi:hypothetical protein
MTRKKYTAKQLRIARELVDQEEAIRAERLNRKPTSLITKMWRRDRRRFIGTTSAIFAFVLWAAPFDLAMGWESLHFDSSIVGEFPTDPIGDRYEGWTGAFTTSSRLYYGGNEWEMPRRDAMLVEVWIAVCFSVVAVFSLFPRVDSVAAKNRRN